MRSRSRSVLLTAAFAVVAHLVLLFAPLTCGCSEGSALPEAAACCCKPGDPPMPCSSGASDAAPGSGGCASAQATCVAEVPEALAGPAPEGASVHVAMPLAKSPISVDPPAAARPARLDSGPSPPRIALVLTRCSVIRV